MNSALGGYFLGFCFSEVFFGDAHKHLTPLIPVSRYAKSTPWEKSKTVEERFVSFPLQVDFLTRESVLCKQSISARWAPMWRLDPPLPICSGHQSHILTQIDVCSVGFIFDESEDLLCPLLGLNVGTTCIDFGCTKELFMHVLWTFKAGHLQAAVCSAMNTRN